MISGAPAIDNAENKYSGPFVTINRNSFYIPIIRIKSNNKYIYSSYNQNSKENKLVKMFHSEDNVVKFNINKYIFNDILVEVLHKGEKAFKLLFVIQFNSFFTTSNYSIKFSRDQIDSIHKDIRYPTDFFVDLFFDNEKEEKLSPFDEYSILWKTMLSEFISKSLKDTSTNNESQKEAKAISSNVENNNNKEETKENQIEPDNYLNNKNDNDIDIDIDNNEEISKGKEKDISNKDEEILEIGNTNNTLAQVNNLLKQIEGNNNSSNKYEDDEQDDEDIEKYLKSLENK
jgi:hypothetical protein